MNVSALSGQHSADKISATVAHLKAFGKALRGVGPVNSNETAAAHRAVLKKFYPEWVATLELLHPEE